MEQERDLTVTWIALGLIILIMVLGIGTYLINNYVDNRGKSNTENEQIYSEDEQYSDEILQPPALPSEQESSDTDASLDGGAPSNDPMLLPQD